MGKMIEDVNGLGGFIDGGDSWTTYPYLWDNLLEHYKPKHILDLGCGQGYTAKYFMDKGVNKVTGMDGSAKARDTIVIPPKRFILHDLREKYPNELICDFIWCCELLEHVEEEYVDNILDIFSRPTVRNIALTHAFPMQGGFHHVNCQPPRYWISKLSIIGFLYNEGLSLKSRRWAPDSHWSRSGMLFERGEK